MKRFLPWFFIVLPFVLLGCAVNGTPGTDPTTVNESQLYVIGLLSSAILYLLKVIVTRFPKVVINREWLSVLLYVVAFLLSLLWGGVIIPAFPPFNDVLTFVTSLFGFITGVLTALGPSVGFAALIYNLFLKRVLDATAVKAGLIEEPKSAPVMKAKKK